jgi:squalene-hopene/tetraprenyl-beta-curcumene cyclase
LRAELMDDRGADDHWTGTLSASALSTATAVSALAIVRRHHSSPELDTRRNLEHMISSGVAWLLRAQNSDGGFGDTDRSHSNIATSMLVAAALRLATADRSNSDLGSSEDPHIDRVMRELDRYIDRTGGVAALRQRYGKDKTFVIPILTNCALAGMVDWKLVQALPFEMAAVPQSFYRWVRMPVVSYAVPALVAIGQARFFHAPPRFPPLRHLRRRVVDRTMRVLTQMQPASGGYLEATPLTSFVLMSLAATDRADSQVAGRAITFLCDSMLEDGSWPIDTNLATWCTSLTIHALGQDPEDAAQHVDQSLVDWLLGCQHRQRHPFTGAEPGGWGWTNLSGAVPDGDDTPAAMLALSVCRRRADLRPETIDRIDKAIEFGAQWLLGLRNRDGGWPTFCRGWGKLPFDRSSTDLTAHALRALDRTKAIAQRSEETNRRIAKAVVAGWNFLCRRQRSDGSLLPLWFGNQDNPDDENPIYGTGRGLLAATAAPSLDATPAGRQARQRVERMLAGAAEYLIANQNDDGGWGGGVSRTRWLESVEASDGEGAGKRSEAKISSTPPGLGITSSVEESAVAVEGLVAFLESRRMAGIKGNFQASGERGCRAAIIRGVEFLCEAVRQSKHNAPWPIGFYFAKLWYHERLYATVFTAAALGSALRVLSDSSEHPAIEKDPRVVDPHAVRLQAFRSEQPTPQNESSESGS